MLRGTDNSVSLCQGPASLSHRPLGNQQHGAPRPCVCAWPSPWETLSAHNFWSLSRAGPSHSILWMRRGVSMQAESHTGRGWYGRNW